jgi:DNA-binding transcriptional LysR family regulator
MTYDQLVAFTTVAAEGTFTGASEALHKSQPAVSKLIRNLEGELGVVLFDRTRYRATLTDSGRVFYERAAAVIESTHALRGFGLALGGKVEPIVRLAVEAVTPLDPIVKILRDVEARFPSVRFELHTERLAGAAEALRDRRADVVVATMLGIDAAKVDATPFARIRIVSVARADHPVSTRRPPIPPALLRGHPQIVLRDSAQGPSPALNVLEGGLRWTVTDIAAKKELILAGMGWGGLPEHVVADELADRTLARRPRVRRGDGPLRDPPSRPRARRRRERSVGSARGRRREARSVARAPARPDAYAPLNSAAVVARVRRSASN